MSGIPVTPEDLFETYLPERFGALAAQAVGSLPSDASPASIAVRLVGEARVFSLRIRAGQLVVGSVVEPDCAVQIAVSRDTLVAVLERAQPHADEVPLEPVVRALQRFAFDAEKAKLIAAVPGTLRLVVREGSRELDVSITPGASDRGAEAAACTLRVDAADLEAVRNGSCDPLQLFFQGKIGIEGDAQIAMLLGSAFMA
jgi:hypothetical protein